MKLFFLIGQSALATICLLWLYLSIDWSLAWRECSQLNLFVLLIIVLQCFFTWLILGKRLSYIFYDKAGFSQCFEASLLCVGCNNIFPLRGGELIKIIWLKRKAKIGMPDLFGGVFLERLLDMSALYLLALAFVSQFLHLWLTGILGSLICLAWLTILWLSVHPAASTKLFAWLPLKSAPVIWTHNLLKFIAATVQPNSFIKLVVATIFMWAMNYAHIFLLANILLSLNLDLGQTGMLCAVVFFSSGLLAVPGGIGGMEALAVLVLETMGIIPAKALAFAILVRLFYTIPPVLSAAAILFHGEDGFFETVRKLRKDSCLKDDIGWR